MQKITTFLTFDHQAEDARNFYTSVFKNSKIGYTRLYGDAGPGEKGKFMTGTFEIEGQTFMVLNAGAGFGFGAGISLFVECKTQEEIDHLWEKLSEGGQKKQCGWLQDKFGITWQIVPSMLGALMGDKDPVKSQSVMKAMMLMNKMDIQKLQQAYDNA
jgi:predicted 3-demethylubiquinone-9 3-methyltransferase (glyoxalase superfamily)